MKVLLLKTEMILRAEEYKKVKEKYSIDGTGTILLDGDIDSYEIVEIDRLAIIGDEIKIC